MLDKNKILEYIDNNGVVILNGKTGNRIHINFNNGFTLEIPQIFIDEAKNGNDVYSCFIRSDSYYDDFYVVDNNFFDFYNACDREVIGCFNHEYVKKEIGKFYPDINDDEKEYFYEYLTGWFHGNNLNMFYDFFNIFHDKYEYSIKDKSECDEFIYDFVDFFFKDKYCWPKFLPRSIINEDFNGEDTTWFQDYDYNFAYIKDVGLLNIWKIIEFNGG